MDHPEEHLPKSDELIWEDHSPMIDHAYEDEIRPIPDLPSDEAYIPDQPLDEDTDMPQETQEDLEGIPEQSVLNDDSQYVDDKNSPLPNWETDHVGTVSGSISGTVSSEMTVGLATVQVGDMEWIANSTGELGLESTATVFDPNEGTPVNTTVKIVPDVTVAADVTSLYINLYRLMIKNGVNLHTTWAKNFITIPM